MKKIITSLITLTILSSAMILPAPSQASEASDEADKRLEQTVENIYKPIIYRKLPDSFIPNACEAVETLLIRSPMNNTRLVASYRQYIQEVAIAVATLSSRCDRGKDYDGNIKRYAKMHTDAMQRYMVESGNNEKTSNDVRDLNYKVIVSLAGSVIQRLENKN